MPSESSEAPEPVPIDWPQCEVDGCIGVKAHESRVCIRHLDDDAARRAALAAPGGHDLRGVRIGEALLGLVIASSSGEADSGRGRKNVLGDARFDHAVFEAPAHLARLHFQGLCTFGATRFEAPVYFAESEFWTSTPLLFNQTIFGGGASFIKTHFMTGALFAHCQLGGTTFNQAASPEREMLIFRCQFETLSAEATEASRFALTDCEGDIVSIRKARFGVLDLQMLRLSTGLSIQECELPHGSIRAIDAADIAATDCRFGAIDPIGPLIATGGATFRNCAFDDRVELITVAGRLDLRRARFADGVTVRVRGADIAADEASFGRPSLITGTQELPGVPEPPRVASERTGPPAEMSGDRLRRPRLVSVRGADLENLTLDDVDLTVCQFVGAHNIDRFRIGSSLLFAETPRRLARTKPHWLARRRMLAEEGCLRHDRSRDHVRWPTVRPDEYEWVMPPEPLDHRDVAELYRSLRKGREDAKDEPGAADFYYGEMEMRRLDETAPWGEQLILNLYWFFSGYGLRASRAFVWLVVVALVFSVLFWKAGFVHAGQKPVSFWRALTYSAGAATLHPPDRVLTTAGEGLAIAERVLAPVLLGLALFSIRGRVRR